MDITREMEKLLVGSYPHGLKFSLEKRAHPFVFSIEITGIAVGKIAHKDGDAILLELFYKKMEMVRH